MDFFRSLKTDLQEPIGLQTSTRHGHLPLSFSHPPVQLPSVHLETILEPTSTYVTAEEINRRIKSILGLLDRDITPYDGGDLPSADAAREIDAVVQVYRAMGDTPVLALTPQTFST
jgi:hypothetical protein